MEIETALFLQRICFSTSKPLSNSGYSIHKCWYVINTFMLSFSLFFLVTKITCTVIAHILQAYCIHVGTCTHVYILDYKCISPAFKALIVIKETAVAHVFCSFPRRPMPLHVGKMIALHFLQNDQSTWKDLSFCNDSFVHLFWVHFQSHFIVEKAYVFNGCCFGHVHV